MRHCRGDACPVARKDLEGAEIALVGEDAQILPLQHGLCLCRHRPGIRVGQRHLPIRRTDQRLIQGQQALNLLLDAVMAVGQMCRPRCPGFLAVNPVRLLDVAPYLGLQMGKVVCDLALGVARSRLLTALNLLPSTATTSPLSTPTRRQSSTNFAQVLRIAGPFRRRKSAMVL